MWCGVYERLQILLKMVTSNEHSRNWRRSILFPPCRIHFVATHSTVRIAFSFDREPFMNAIELTIFLDFLHSRKARTLDQIQAPDLSEFLSCRADLPPVGKIRRDRWLQPTTVARIVSDL